MLRKVSIWWVEKFAKEFIMFGYKLFSFKLVWVFGCSLVEIFVIVTIWNLWDELE